jgi:pyridoxine/pyridoxamine 5'-phosphate oxidase
MGKAPGGKVSFREKHGRTVILALHESDTRPNTRLPLLGEARQRGFTLNLDWFSRKYGGYKKVFHRKIRNGHGRP